MKLSSRRLFLTTLAAAPLVLTARAARATTPAAPAARALRFNHLHTGEKLAVEYFQAGRYQPDALAAVNHLLRDFRTGDVHDIDPALLDVLFDLHQSTETRRSFEVISGYRSPKTNAGLRKKSEGVAARSLHMSGRAIDIRVGDVPLAALRRSALALGKGGVGYYPASNFVHVDTGRVRTW
ncbi:MAG TPA: YcbK family protein [Vicinamibacterales bacterium]|nr:YcbK family protein [Vicinamibacterales bacterium]